MSLCVRCVGDGRLEVFRVRLLEVTIICRGRVADE